MATAACSACMSSFFWQPQGAAANIHGVVICSVGCAVAGFGIGVS